MNTILIAIGISMMSVLNLQPVDIHMAAQESESSVFVRSDLSDPHQEFWAEMSEQIRGYRVEKNYSAALGVIENIIELEPKSEGLMHVWNGDIHVQAEDYENALAEYELAEAEFGSKIINKKTVGETALKQATRAAIKFKHPETAAQYARKLAIEYPESSRAEIALAWSLYYQAMSENDLQVMALETAQYTGLCSSTNPCYIKDKQLYRQSEIDITGFQDLVGSSGFYFYLNQQEQNILEQILNPSDKYENESLLMSLIPAAHAEAGEVYQTCVIEDTPAYSGFALPISDITYGDLFMGYPASAGCSGEPGVNYSCSYSWYHPGVDFNNSYDHEHVQDDYGNWIEVCTNPNDGFNTVAAGCVQDVDVASWGSLTITHNYAPFNGSYDSDYVTSQYGHADEVDVSEGFPVALEDDEGDRVEVGSIGAVGGDFACHLHFEIREEDHPDPYHAGHWDPGSEDEVGQYYQDPESFIEGHPAFDWLHWIDEGSSMWSHTGTWVPVTTKGNGDGHEESDLYYTSTTSSPNPTATATLRFTASNSGDHQLYMFAPWSTQTKSNSVPIEITEVNGGGTILSDTFDFAGGDRTCDRDINPIDGIWEGWSSTARCDEWLLIGDVDLTDGEEYEMYISNATGSSSDIIIIDDLYVIYEDGYEPQPQPALYKRIIQNDDEDDCSVPGSGDWTVTSDCTISSDEVAPANVIVADSVTLTINGNGSLDMDLSSYHLRIGIGSRVIIGVGGKID